MSTFTQGDRKVVGRLAHRLTELISADGKQLNLTEESAAQLHLFLANYVSPRERELAIGTLVQFAYVLEKKFGGEASSNRLLTLAGALLPKQ